MWHDFCLTPSQFKLHCLRRELQIDFLARIGGDTQNIKEAQQRGNEYAQYAGAR